MNLPRERRGGRRRASRSTTTTWTETAYRLWREGCQPVQIADALRRNYGSDLTAADVERLVLERAARDLQAIWDRAR
jgi:hypothetical protein